MKKVLDSNLIKFIAVIAMTIDHATWAFYPGFPVEPIPIFLHVIGRLTCPIMCYFIAEGYFHTKDINKYTLRLFLFSVIGHFAYALGGFSYLGENNFIPFKNGEFLNQTSVMWALAWGLVMLRVMDSFKIKNIALKIVLIMVISVIALPSDWSCIASFCILFFGMFRDNPKLQFFWLIFFVGLYSVTYFLEVNKVYGIVQMGVVFSIPLLLMYNGKRAGSKLFNNILKWGFYIYYPLHLLVIGYLRTRF